MPHSCLDPVPLFPCLRPTPPPPLRHPWLAVSLTKVKKKTRDWKDGVMGTVKQSAESYNSVYVFRYENLRNEAMKDIREQLKESSRFVMGSGKMMKAALGKGESDEVRPKIADLANVRGMKVVHRGPTRNHE